MPSRRIGTGLLYGGYPADETKGTDDVDESLHRIEGGPSPASALLIAPPTPSFVYVLAHGAGAGMRHPFMASICNRLAERGAATLRYQFPYMEAGKGRVDGPAVAEATVRAAVGAASALVSGVPIIAGGKSFGGRMTSQAQAAEPIPGVRGLAFLGFPLHPPNNPGTSRAEHLQNVHVPMLFLQGTRDQFARLDLLEPLVTSLGEGARLVLTKDGDHSFNVRRASGQTNAHVLDALADSLLVWGKHVSGAAAR